MVLVQFAFTTSLEMKLLWLRKWYPIGVKFVFMDRGHIVLHYDRRDRKVNGHFLSYSSPSRSIRCFLRFLENPWQRGSETSGLAMLLVRACGAETFVSWMLLERAEASGVFMLELNFHSVSSIYSSQLTSMSDCYRTGALGVLFPFFFRLLVFMLLPIFSRFIMLFGLMAFYWIYDFELVCRVRRLSACGYVMLFPPPKL
uniref:Uncharacterized protein n=1 Tax=Brassica oleracea TaxID=3712 RepID=A0A3P6C919_BRAOL|nr:unnamed protein product [Brassica oleracea]